MDEPGRLEDPVPFGNYQYEVYLKGMAGEQPDLPFAYAELERAARDVLADENYDYVAGGAGSEDTMRANLEAFRRWRIVPRMLRDMTSRDLTVELFGTRLPAPVLLAPIGVLSLAHEEAEVAAARAAAEVGAPVVLSTSSTKSLEEVAEANGDGLRWFQLYWPNDPELAVSFLDRAAAAGYSAIVTTLDTFTVAWRPRDLQSAFLPFLRGEGIGNFTSDPVFREGLSAPPEEDMGPAIGRWVQVFPNLGATWDQLSFLREHTDLPILLKGILHPDDAREAADRGMNGVVVSNHGGRQVDGAIATLDALPAIVDAVPDDFTVLMDSGIRTGADVVKALALGARAILLGRPYVWGLAAGGQPGVVQAVRALLAELDLTMALSGVRSVTELGPEVLLAAR